MAPRKPRDLRPDERALWAKVKATTEPLNTKAKVTSSPSKGDQIPDPSTAPAIQQQKPTPILATVGKTTKPPAISKTQKVSMDRQAFRKMTRGKMKPEARLDLHGMTLAQAHPALEAFIRNAYTSGKRLVLVITGKGKFRDDDNVIPTKTGVLRHQVPQWLAQQTMTSMILQVAPASQNYGGSGAYFVYLRRGRG